MDKIACLLKFGKREHLMRLQEGKVYFTTAKICREQEKQRKERGIGDDLEGGMMFSIGEQYVKLQFEPVDNIPVLCMLLVREDDCIVVDDNHYLLKLPESTKKWFQEHFSEYDTVAVITDPEQFSRDMETAFSEGCVHKEVEYVNHDQRDQARSDTHPIQTLFRLARQDGKNKWSAKVDDAYELLFLKDLFFQAEREYRFVLKDREQNTAQELDVVMHSPVLLFSLEDFWNGVTIERNIRT